MSKWLVVLTIISIQLQFHSISSYSTVYRHSETGRKLFGGYRIVPKSCTVEADGKESKPKTGICMFNYECSQRGGEMIGSCIDGFLFGVCCSVPFSPSNVELENDDAQSFGSYGNTLQSTSTKKPILSNNEIKGTTSTTMLPPRPESIYGSVGSNMGNGGAAADQNAILPAAGYPNADQLISSLITGGSATLINTPPKRKPILEQYFGNQTNGGFIDNQDFLPTHTYPSADTILLNPDGSIVEDDKNPENLFTPQTTNYQVSSKPTTHGPNKWNYDFVANHDTSSAINDNKFKVEVTTKNSIDSIYKLSTRPSTTKAANIDFTYQYEIKRPLSPNGYNTQGPTTFTYPYPTIKPSYIIAEENTVLIDSVGNINSSKVQTTKRPMTSSVTSKVPPTPSYFATKIPTTSSNIDVDNKYPSFNYDTYSGMSKPPILLPQPVELVDGVQAINHIIGILNTSEPRPDQIETHTTPPTTVDAGLTTWVSVLEEDKPIKHSPPKPSLQNQGIITSANINEPSYSVEFGRPGTTTNYQYETSNANKRPGTTSTMYIHGPSYSIISEKPGTTSTTNVVGPSYSVSLSKPGTTSTTYIQGPSYVVSAGKPGTTATTYVKKPTQAVNLVEPGTTTSTHTQGSSQTVGLNKPGIIITQNVGPSHSVYSSTPGVTSNTYVHGPSYSVTQKRPTTTYTTLTSKPPHINQNKPIPTVVILSQNTSPNGYYTQTRPSSTTGQTQIIYKVTTTKKPSILTSKPSKPIHFPQNVFHTGQENFVNFPPVRNPDLEVTGLNQVEKPTLVQTYGTGPSGVIHLPVAGSSEVAPENIDVNLIDSEDDYNDFTTPPFPEDKVQGQVHSFVEKLVNSLSGNFQDLEQILFKNDNQSTITNSNGIQLSNINIGEGTVSEPANNAGITPTRKPTKKPTITKPIPPSDTLAETNTPNKRPKPTSSTTVPTKKPTKRPNTTTSKPVKVPTVTSTRKPSTTSKKPITSPPTKKPTTVTTTRPTVTTTTTKKPVVTKRPKPATTTKRTTTTTTTTVTTPSTIIQQNYEVTEGELGNESVTSTEESTQASEGPAVDYKRECGVRPLVKKGGRIVGGKGSQFGYYPWQVLVRESTWLGLFTKNKCGGVLITNKYVITAAHCQPGFLASLTAVFGEYDISGELEPKRAVIKNVRRVIVHRQYDPATFENDLALLELDSPVVYQEHIVPICMPKEGEDYVGRMATVTGWGRLKYGGGVPSVLQEVRVPLIENSVCQEMFQTAGHQKRIISSFLCAGYANGQKDSCEGDSGGPLMIEREDGRWVLIGTVSHGIKCAAPYLPGVYMRTTYYKPWLKSITGVNT